MTGSSSSDNRAAVRHRRTYWTLQVIGWTLYGGLGALMIALFGYFNTYLLAVEVCVAVVLLLTSHGLRLVLLRQGWKQLSAGQLLWRLALTLGGLALLAQAVLYVVIRVLVRPPAAVGGMENGLQFVGYTIQTYFVFWLWAALYFGWHYLRGYRQSEVDKWKLKAAVREAEMRTLKAQLNPHFLFNGLNNIRALVMEDPTRARTMMTHLSDLLRYSIQVSGTEQVALGHELELVEHYLQLEALQLEERLAYSLDVDPATRSVLIPPMTLQLLVENAIKHGLAPRPEGGCISLSAALDATGAELLVVVSNTGAYQPAAPESGVGLRNVRERLHLLFGAAAQLTIANDLAQPDTVTAHLRLPVRRLDAGPPPFSAVPTPLATYAS